MSVAGAERLGGRRVLPPALLFAALMLVVYADPLFLRRNFAGRDLIAYNLPMEKSIHDAWARGHLPVWNAEVSGGRPLLPNPNGGALYPVRILLSRLPFPLAMRIYPVAHWIAAGIGMIVLCLSLGRSSVAAWIAASTYVLSGVGVSEVFFPHIQPGMTLLPWIVWAVARRSGSWPSRILLLAILFALDLLAADVFTITLALVCAACWIGLEEEPLGQRRSAGRVGDRGRHCRARGGSSDSRHDALDPADEPRRSRHEALGDSPVLDSSLASRGAADPVSVRPGLGPRDESDVGLLGLSSTCHGHLRDPLFRSIRRHRDPPRLEVAGARCAFRASGIARRARGLRHARSVARGLAHPDFAPAPAKSRKIRRGHGVCVVASRRHRPGRVGPAAALVSSAPGRGDLSDRAVRGEPSVARSRREVGDRPHSGVCRSSPCWRPGTFRPPWPRRACSGC